MIPSRPFLEVDGLAITYVSDRSETTVVKGVSFSLRPGAALGIIGESGSGKSTIARALLGLEPPGSEVRCEGIVKLDGKISTFADVTALRGRAIAMAFQDPLGSLDPLMTAAQQIREAIKDAISGAEKDARVRELLDLVRLPQRAVHSYPHELSGGMRQRVVLAIAMACRPALLVADEPTTALDVSTQREILELIASLKAKTNMALLLISHDLGIVAKLCEEVQVMAAGRFIEGGPIEAVYRRPSHGCTRDLIATSRAVGPTAVPRVRETPPDAPIRRARDILELVGVEKHVTGRDGVSRHLLRNIDLRVERGETVALVGESGSGKSTLARVALSLTPYDAGDVRIGGEVVTGLRGRRLRHARRKVQPVFQDASAAFNPRHTVQDILRQALRYRHVSAGPTIGCETLLDMVQLAPAATFLGRYPHQLSGGQRQRLGIARALAVAPELIIADEPLSGADVSIRAKVIDLLKELQERTGVAYLFITHDIWLARSFAHRVAVMMQGEIVEQGDADVVTRTPQSSYCRELLAASLSID